MSCNYACHTHLGADAVQEGCRGQVRDVMRNLEVPLCGHAPRMDDPLGRLLPVKLQDKQLLLSLSPYPHARGTRQTDQAAHRTLALQPEQPQ